MTPQEWTALIKDFGVPVAVMIAMFGAGTTAVAALAYGLRAIFRWGAPIVEKVADAHVTTVIGLTETQRHLGLKLDEHHDDEQPRLQRMETKLGDVHETVTETRDHVLKLVRSVPGGS